MMMTRPTEHVTSIVTDQQNMTSIRFLMEGAFITSGLPPADELRYNSSVFTDVRSQ